MAIFDLKLVKLHYSLIVFYGSFILLHQFFLVIQDLLGNSFALGTKVLKIHLCLRQQVLVSLERSLRLQKCGLELAIIDVRQRVALIDELALLISHCKEYPGHLAKDGHGIDRSDRPDGVQINPNIPLLGRCSRNRDLRRCSRIGLFLAAENQVERNRKEQQQRAPNEYSQHSTPCTALSRNALDVSGNLDPGNSAEFFSESM